MGGGLQGVGGSERGGRTETEESRDSWKANPGMIIPSTVKHGGGVGLAIRLGFVVNIGICFAISLVRVSRLLMSSKNHLVRAVI